MRPRLSWTTGATLHVLTELVSGAWLSICAISAVLSVNDCSLVCHEGFSIQHRVVGAASADVYKVDDQTEITIFYDSDAEVADDAGIGSGDAGDAAEAGALAAHTFTMQVLFLLLLQGPHTCSMNCQYQGMSRAGIIYRVQFSDCLRHLVLLYHWVLWHSTTPVVCS